MANSIITTEGDGSTVQFVLNFTLGILKRSYVKCRVGTEVDGLGNPLYRSLEWVTDSLVNILGAVPGDGVPIVFTRTVPKDALLHDYSNGAAIEESNLDESNLQTIMSVHEFLDGRIEGGFLSDLDMNGYRLINLGPGTSNTDAATVEQLNSMSGLLDDAEEQANISTVQAGIATAQAVIATTKATEAAASAAIVNLPAIVATDTGTLLQVNSSGTGYSKLLPGPVGTVITSNGPDSPVSYQNIPGIGVVPLDSGGTGETTALEAFDALKQDATTSYKGVVELATSAEAQGSGANVVLTPSSMAGNQSLGANGYMILPGGVIVQQGIVTTTGAFTSVSFPVTFPNRAFVFAQPIDATFIAAAENAHAHNITNSGFEVAGYLNNSGSSCGIVNWFAIGN